MLDLALVAAITPRAPQVAAVTALTETFACHPRAQEPTVVAERVGWEHPSSVLRARVAELRPLYARSDPADRTVYTAGEIVQCDLWFPGKVMIHPGVGHHARVVSGVLYGIDWVGFLLTRRWVAPNTQSPHEVLTITDLGLQVLEKRWTGWRNR